MFRKILLLLMIALPTGNLMARQMKKGYKWEWQVGTAVGFNLPITKLFNGKPTDLLIDFSNNTAQYQLYSLGVFFHPRWGVEFTMSMSNPRKSDRRSKFNEAMQREYPDRYFIDPGTSFGHQNFSYAGNLRAMVGITYRWEKNRFLLYPKLSLGSTEIHTNSMISYLKEKESNHYQELLFSSPGYKDPSPLTVGLSAVAGYRITRWLTVNAELQSTYFRSNFSIEKMILEIDTRNLVSSEKIRDKASVLTLTPQIGLVLCFKPNPNPSSKTRKQKTKKNRKSGGVLPIL